MKAFILAAGLGTRLRPWTLEHPKALVPVGGMPMLERVILRMRDQGFGDITVNVHHFAGQIVDFLNTRDFGVSIHVSDERERLLDTGGAILHASRFLAADLAPFLVHNVDILSDAPLASLMQKHIGSGRDISLVTSERKSSRRLLFDADGTLAGWHILATDEYRAEGFCRHAVDGIGENAFRGLFVVVAHAVDSFREYADRIGSSSFPLMDYLMQRPQKADIGEIRLDSLNLIDIGKPETLGLAESLWSGK